jgi:Oxidoreductase NAD-binding domain
MAGLGTGAAPFRAFLQHRLQVIQQGKSVGPMLYYFGSRHRSQEYLYGEEIEAYMKDGVITHAGLAFSRDASSKVYIQHKMREDGQLLADLISGEGDTPEKSGVFYLCGPTWPVPDVYNALVDALSQYKGWEKGHAGEYIEGLKEKERYVLEVRYFIGLDRTYLTVLFLGRCIDHALGALRTMNIDRLESYMWATPWYSDRDSDENVQENTIVLHIVSEKNVKGVYLPEFTENP